jgi:hypothetical protein
MEKDIPSKLFEWHISKAEWKGGIKGNVEPWNIII